MPDQLFPQQVIARCQFHDTDAQIERGAEDRHPQPAKPELLPEELARVLTEQLGHRLPLWHGQRVQKDPQVRQQGAVELSGVDQQYLCMRHALSHLPFVYFEPLARAMHRGPLQCLRRPAQPEQHGLEHHRAGTRLSSRLPSVNWLRIVPIPGIAQSRCRWRIRHWLHQIGEPIDRAGLMDSAGDLIVEE